MRKGNIKRIVSGAAAGAVVLFGASFFSSCDIEMIKEEGYSEGMYEIASKLTQIEIDGDGGIVLSLSYGEKFGVSYTESNQEKFSFAEENGKLKIVQKRQVGSLFNYKAKELSVTFPAENKLEAFHADIDGTMTANVQAGEYGAFSFDVDGSLELNFYDVTAEKVSVDCDGSFKASLTGSANELVAKGDGALSVSGKNFVADNASFKCDGAMKVEITCNLFFFVDCDGVCSGTYYGNAAVEKRISGVDNLEKGE